MSGVPAREEREPRRSSLPPQRPASTEAVIRLQSAHGNAALSQTAPSGIAARAGDAAGLQASIGNAAVAQARVGRIPAGPARPRLQWGSIGPAVEELQIRLNEDGADPPLVPDGKFFQLTQAAVRAFQRRHGLIVDGIVGRQTWGVIDALERAGIAGPMDALAGARPVTHQQHDRVEQALHPGVSVVNTPLMTGAGRGGSFEREMHQALDDYLDSQVDPAMNTPAPAGEIAAMRAIADTAQEVTEAFYDRWITMASRRPTGSYHPGSFTIPLTDASTRRVTREDAAGWVDYFMQEPTYSPHQVLVDHHIDTSRARPDRAEVTRVRDLYVFNAARFDKVRTIIRGWSAEAGTGTVFVQPRQYQGRAGRWNLFKTLIHEFLHLVVHPNYDRTAVAMGGASRQILIEGIADHLTLEVWHHLRDRLEAETELRRRVEGSLFADEIDPSFLDDPTTYDQAAPNTIISEVGEENVRVAYFMGHTEFLGIGAGTRSESLLRRIATWQPTDNPRADHYLVRSGGETVEQISARTNSDQIAELGGTVLTNPGQRLRGGHELVVQGIRWHHAIREDTRAQVANQSGLTQEELERANEWPYAPGDTSIPAGTLVLIPRH